MNPTVIHGPTRTGAHAGPPGGDPAENISVLRNALSADASWQYAADAAQAEALALRNRLHEAEARARDLETRLSAEQRENRALDRALHGMQDHIDATNHAWRQVNDLNADLKTQLDRVRAERDTARRLLAPRGRRRRT